METFHLPYHEINERFTKSELFIVAWRSQETHHHLKRRMKNEGYDGDTSNYPKGSRNQLSQGPRRHRYGSNDIIPEGLPDKFYAQEEMRDKDGKVMASPGEINLAQVTGEEARKYMAAIGMPFPAILNVAPRM